MSYLCALNIRVEQLWLKTCCSMVITYYYPMLFNGSDKWKVILQFSKRDFRPLLSDLTSPVRRPSVSVPGRIATIIALFGARKFNYDNIVRA